MNKFADEITDRLKMARNRIDEMIETNDSGSQIERTNLVMVSREMEMIGQLNEAFDPKRVEKTADPVESVKTIPDTDPMVKVSDLEAGMVPINSTVKVELDSEQKPSPESPVSTAGVDSAPAMAENSMASA